MKLILKASYLDLSLTAITIIFPTYFPRKFSIYRSRATNGAVTVCIFSGNFKGNFEGINFMAMFLEYFHSISLILKHSTALFQPLSSFWFRGLGQSGCDGVQLHPSILANGCMHQSIFRSDTSYRLFVWFSLLITKSGSRQLKFLIRLL